MGKLVRFYDIYGMVCKKVGVCSNFLIFCMGVGWKVILLNRIENIGGRKSYKRK